MNLHTHYYWLVVWNIFNFPIYWVANHPNWLSYFSEGWPNHQPDYGDITGPAGHLPRAVQRGRGRSEAPDGGRQRHQRGGFLGQGHAAAPHAMSWWGWKMLIWWGHRGDIVDLVCICMYIYIYNYNGTYSGIWWYKSISMVYMIVYNCIQWYIMRFRYIYIYNGI